MTCKGAEHRPSSSGLYCKTCHEPIFANPVRFACDNDVLTRAYEVALNDALLNVHMFQDGALTEPARCIMAGEIYDTPWTRDASINVWNAFAILDREVSRNTLMSVLEKMDGGGYVIAGEYWDAIIWAIGAYQYILVSGDQDFVKIAQSAIANSLAKYEREEFDEKDGLFRGPAVYGDGVAAYPDAYAKTASSGIEEWTDAPENRSRVAKKGVGIPMKALSTNCIYYKAYLILAKLNEMLGKDGSDALKKAKTLKVAINKAFWNEAKGSYDYLAGECDYQEALGISYALLFGIADERQAKLVLKNVKVTEQGIACVEPSFDRYLKAGGFGRHSGVVWPHAQGFWARAAFEKGDSDAFEAELHALAGKASRDGQFYEVYHPETGEAYGGLQEKWDGKKRVIGDWMSCPHQTWSATAYLSLIYYHVLGADIREGEVVFKPYLPEGVNEIAVKDFKVGETTFDVVVVRGGGGPKEATCKTPEKKRVKLFLSVAKENAAPVAQNVGKRGNAIVEDVVELVDPFIGTGGNGHTTPAAAYPFGMVQPGPDTGHEGWERCSAYQYGDKEIQRFSQNHLSGTGCSEFGDLGFMPSAGNPKEALGRDYKCGFEKKSEKASPGYYAVTLDCGTKVEATCTRHVSLFRFTFPKGKPATLLFDPSWSFDKTKSVQVSPMKKRRVSGHVDREGWPGHEYWFAWEISADPVAEKVVEYVGDARVPKTVYSFENLGNGERGMGNGERVLYLKVSLSRTSEEGARRNIDEEIPGWDFDGVLKANQDKWRDILGRVKANGESHKLKNFYTAIYHLCFQPNLISDVGEDDLYSTFSCWDTYRAAGPLYTILTPEYVPAFINSMLWHFDNNGFLPKWTLWGGDNQCMNGAHSVPMIVDAYLKWGTGNGERGMGNGEWGTVDWERAYECVKATLREDRGRCDAEYEMLDKYGYFPCDLMDEESVSRLLESCYDDACAARFAKALGGREDDAKFFLDRSRAWTNCFDAATGFIRAKDSKGAWREPFDPYAIDGKGLHNYTEGNAFHWNWHVMQEPKLLIEMLGGKSAAVKRLEGLFNEDSTKNDGELSDVTGLIGQYCQGNEPCHHDIYFFTLMGRRDLAAKYVGEVMETQYYPSPTGLCGNEDCGQMSAWYVFSAMGFYPFDPCGGEYVLGEPQLEEIKLRVGNGNAFDVLAAKNAKGAKVLLNGKKMDGAVIRHEDIVKDGTLAFAGGSAKYNYVVDTSAAPELDQWMRTKMLPVARKWYPKLVKMFPSEGWEEPKKIAFNFDAREECPPAYTCGDVVTFGRKWIKGNPGDVGCGIHEIFHVVQDDYPDEKTFWLQEGIADYVRWYLYEPESHGCDMDLSSVEVHYDCAYRVSANFLDFIERKYPGTVRELNALCRQNKYDEKTYWKKRTGKDVKELETEWKNQSKQPFRNYRFCVDRTKCPTDCMQLSEFELLDADGKAIPSGKFQLGFDGRGGDDNFGDGEKPECAVDGNLDTKWLDFRANHNGNAARRSAVWIQFKFAEPTKLSGYRWYTANDCEDRDPQDWRLLGSNDGVNWVVVDKVEGFEATSDRNKLAFTAHL